MKKKFQIKNKIKTVRFLFTFRSKKTSKSKIENGILNEGEYLPSEFKLMERYGVSVLQYDRLLKICVRKIFLRNNAESVQWSKARIPDFPREILVICSISMKKLKKNPIYLQRMFLNFVLFHPILL